MSRTLSQWELSKELAADVSRANQTIGDQADRIAELEAKLEAAQKAEELLAKLWRVMHRGHPVVTLTLRVDQPHHGPDKIWCSIENFDTELEIGRGPTLADAIAAIKEENHAADNV